MMAIKQLRVDKDCMILNADKGVALVVMDRQDYIRKARNLLADTTTYRPIQSDPINKHKAKLINILKNIKAEIGMYPTGASSPNFIGSQKFIRKISP